MLLEAEKISKYYKLYKNKREGMKDVLIPFRDYHEKFYAVKNLDFKLEKGESVGIIGRNGSGKSTLLKLLGGITPPSSGTVKRKGSAAAILELGRGFNPYYTGRENIYFYGAIFGLNKTQMNEKAESIIDFADIGAYIDQPVRSYSSGMFLRLAFAVNSALEPDIFFIDEILSVGDIFFQQKCLKHIQQLRENGTTFVIVSHDMELIDQYTDRTILLNMGDKLFEGNSQEAVRRYYHLKAAKKLSTVSDMRGGSSSDNNSRVIGGNKEVEYRQLIVYDEAGNERSTFETGESAVLAYEFELKEDIKTPVPVAEVYSRTGIVINSKAGLHYKTDVPEELKQGSVIKVRQRVRLNLRPDSYSLLVGLAEMEPEAYEKAGSLNQVNIDAALNPLLRVLNAAEIQVTPRTEGLKFPFMGLTDLDGDMQIEIS